MNTDEDPRLADLTEKELLFEMWSELRAFRRFVMWGVVTFLVIGGLFALTAVIESS